MRFLLFFVLTSFLVLFAGETRLISSSFVLKDHNGKISVELKKQGAEIFQITAFPNPFKPATTISVPPTSVYGNTSLKIYSVQGILVANLSNRLKPGEKSVVWSPGRVSSGVYFVRWTNGSVVKLRKILLAR